MKPRLVKEFENIVVETFEGITYCRSKNSQECCNDHEMEFIPPGKTNPKYLWGIWSCEKCKEAVDDDYFRIIDTESKDIPVCSCGEKMLLLVDKFDYALCPYCLMSITGVDVNEKN